ncbi:MAG: hypothetical protein K0U41_02560 [Gammaproteobacteria bacterium]|nr:hypothetical protein [Gammaproteobacteria bacterium]
MTNQTKLTVTPKTMSPMMQAIDKLFEGKTFDITVDSESRQMIDCDGHLPDYPVINYSFAFFVEDECDDTFIETKVKPNLDSLGMHEINVQLRTDYMGGMRFNSVNVVGYSRPGLAEEQARVANKGFFASLFG